MKHRTPQQWQKLFKQQATSGLSVAVFCKKHGIGRSCFYKHKNGLTDNKTNSATQKFIKVKPQQVSHTTTSLIKIQHQQTQLHFPLTISAIWLADFVKALA